AQVAALLGMPEPGGTRLIREGLLQALIEERKGVPEGQQIHGLFTLVVRRWVRELVKAKAEDVLNQLLASEPDIIAAMGKRRQEIVDTEMSNVTGLLFRNPAAAFGNEANVGDIYLSPESDLFQPRNLTEAIIHRFLKLPPSETNYHSFGQFSVLGPTLTYLARQTARMLQQNRKNATRRVSKRRFLQARRHLSKKEM